jgi:hypothetical protein
VTATQRWQGAGGTALGARRAGGAVPVAPADARGKRPQVRGSSRRAADPPARAGGRRAVDSPVRGAGHRAADPPARAAERRARDVPIARAAAPAVSRRRLRRLRPRGAGAVALAVLAFSALGLLYLLQISRVASYGYTLSTIQARQAQLDREYELLLYQVSQERTPARVDDLARREYGMQPLDPGADAEGQPPAAAGTGAAATPAKPKGAATAPRYRFLTAQRPAVEPPATGGDATRAVGLIDRLWQRMVGVGVAGQP